MFKSKLFKTICKKWFSHKFRFSSNTIFALSSGQGKCGVAVIRVSGSSSKTALETLTTLSVLPKPRTAILRSIKHPISQDIIDKGLILWFPGPKSFTGEDSCEFYVHGGKAVIQGILEALSCLPNFKLAEPGEFTRRAFLNGKLNLIEVEGLADLLQAETEMQRKQAYLQSTGHLSQLYTSWNMILRNCVANIEAHIDFDETESLDNDIIKEVNNTIQQLTKEIENHLKDGRKGELLRSGVRAVILGEPNVGKSSLLNILCQRQVSIVTPICGTTRDVIEVSLNVNGYPLVLADTAGLRHGSNDVIEIEGMSRARHVYDSANLVILVIDCQNYLQSNYCGNFEEYLKNYTKQLDVNFNEKPFVIVINKIDLDVNEICFNVDAIKLSCTTEDGVTVFLDNLTKHLKELCGQPSEEHPSMNQIRHTNQIKKCQKYLKRFLEESHKGGDVVLMAEYLRGGMRSIGKLVGTFTTEDILDVIFKEFCIGK